MKPSAHRPDVRAGGLVSVLRLLRQPRPRLRRVAELDQVERHVRALPRLPAGRESWSGLRTPGFSGSERGGTANSNLARTTTRRGRLTRSSPSAGGPPRQKGWSRTKTTRNGRACTTWASWVPRPALAEPSGHLEPDRVTTARSPRSRRGRRPGVEGGRPRSPRSQHVARASRLHRIPPHPRREGLPQSRRCRRNRGARRTGLRARPWGRRAPTRGREHERTQWISKSLRC